MLSITFGNYNYLGVLYNRLFFYKNTSYTSIKVALLAGACNSKEELEDLLLYRILQNEDFLLYLIEIDGEIKYINVLPLIFGNCVLSCELLGGLYRNIRRRACAAGAHSYKRKNGTMAIGVSQIDETYVYNKEDELDAIKLNKLLCSNYRKHQRKYKS